jgi:hypothetical protein
VRRALAILLVLSALLGACNPGEKPADQDEPGLISSGRCANEAEVVADQATWRDGRLRGDVDGDGIRDEVFIADGAGEPGCRLFLVARVAGVILSAPIPPQEGAPSGLGLPSLSGLAEIDGRPGLDVYLTVLAGASTSFLTVFSAGSGKLSVLDLEGGEFGALFPTGGSAGHAEASDCLHRRVAITKATPARGDRWNAERSFFRLRGDRFVKDEKPPTLLRNVKLNALPEFRGTPFGNCRTSGV